MSEDTPNPAAMEMDPALAAELEKLAGGELSQNAFVIGEGDLPLPPEDGGPQVEAAPEPTSVQPIPEDFAAGEPAEEMDFPDPNENSNPAIAVEEMLSAGVMDLAETDLAEPIPARAMDALAVPTFQISLKNFSAAKDKLKNLGSSFGFPEDVWKNEAPIFSQLSEYQAVAFRKLARELGVEAEIAIHFPPSTVSEEEEALGDLAAIPDADLPFTEGAPAVDLPRAERDVMVLVDPLLGVSIRESFGIITAHRSIPRKLFREDEAQAKLQKELKRVGSRTESEIPDSQLTIQIRILVRDLQKLALQRGANAVVGFQLQSFSETNHLDPGLDQLRLVAFGTAAVVEKV
jgi:uncharacterized protein YbjQ (UPF0145 family)